MSRPVLLHPALESVPEDRFKSSARASVPALLVLGGLVAGYALLFGWLSLQRYWAYEMHALDMGNMGQAAWNTIHFHPFHFTNMRLPYAIEAWGTTTRLSFHVEALFPIISLVYLIYPQPESLLVLQTVALAAGAVPVYLLGREVLKSTWLGVVFAAAYLLFPSLEALNLYEFHPVAMATPLLLFAFLYAWRRQYVPFLVCCLLAMGTKEQIGLVVAMFGLYVTVMNRDRLVGLWTAFIGVAWSLLAVLVVEHHYRTAGTVTYSHSRYGYLGHGIRGIAHTLLSDPTVVVRHVFTWPKLAYVVHLLGPTGFLSMLYPPALLLGAPTAALNLLSTSSSMTSALGDNSAELISVIIIAAILGTRQLFKMVEPFCSRRTLALVVGTYVLIVSLWSQRVDGFTPLGSRFDASPVSRHQQVANRFVGMIPSLVPVSTQDQLDPHLSSRRYLYLFEDTGRPPDPPSPPANYILLDVSAPTYPLPSYQLYDAAQHYVRRPGWGIAAGDDGLILIRKGASRKVPPARFYGYMRPAKRPDHLLQEQVDGLQLTGYDVRRVDLPNVRVPNLAYTFYLRVMRRVGHDLQPVVYELMGGKVIGCTPLALGLSWQPTSTWAPHRSYVIRMQQLELSGDWQTPGTSELRVGLQPMTHNPNLTCSALLRQTLVTRSLGHRSIQF